MTKFDALLEHLNKIAPDINALPKHEQIPAFEEAMRDFEVWWAQKARQPQEPETTPLSPNDLLGGIQR